MSEYRSEKQTGNTGDKYSSKIDEKYRNQIQNPGRKVR